VFWFIFNDMAEKNPSLIGMYAKGLWLGLLRRQGVLKNTKIPEFSVKMNGVRPDQNKIVKFEKVCGIETGRTEMPPCFPETLFLPLMGDIILSPEFPVSPLGLIHTRQTIIHRIPIVKNAVLDLKCRLASVKTVDRGVEIIFSMEVLSGGILHWEGQAVFLSRNKGSRKQGKPPHPESVFTFSSPTNRILFDVPERIGFAYAAASGDYNIHHLWKFTARLFGFQRPIVHGMWTLSRSLTLLHQMSPIDPPFKADISFKRPVFIPSTLSLYYEKNVAVPVRSSSLRFEIKDEIGSVPLAAGEIVKM
jgi:hypothetical protein